MEPVVFFELPAHDMKRAKEFYERAFEWNIDPTYEPYYYADTSETGDNHRSEIPGVINGAIQRKDDSIGTTRIAICVSNIDETIEKIIRAGGEIFIPKKQIPGMYYSIIKDTEGNEINIFERI